MADDKYSKLVLGVDLDGLCADFYSQMREDAAEWLEKNVSEKGKRTRSSLSPAPGSLSST